MKKLLIVLTASVFAVCSNAASIEWTAMSGYLCDGTGVGTARITSGTAYLMLTAYSQSSLVTAFASANGDASATLTAMKASTGNYLGTGSIANTARISGGTGTISSTDAISAYFVVFNGDNMYISDTASATYDNVMQSYTLSFGSMYTSSKALPMDASAGYKSAGWYNVPEPTSAILLLLGFAGLALKRKNA